MQLLLWLACVVEPNIEGLDTAVCVPTEERCNGADDDCDGDVDEIFDVDQDGYLVDSAACRALGLPTDCDDDNATVYPGATEQCDDNIDQDCSGAANDAPDADQDGFSLCNDCDDTDSFVFPGAAEACNDIDDNCSGSIDENWDQDGDGSALCPNAIDGDCDDLNPLQAPTLPEICDDIDNNCDSQIDEGFDQDGDGLRSCRGDCDDSNPAVYPTAPELCDGFDNDCDSNTSEDMDIDGDGLTFCEGDCNDLSSEVLPGLPEVCDGLDNDCDGLADPLPECWGCVDVGGGYLACNTYTTWSLASGACAAFGQHLAVAADAEDDLLIGTIGRDYFAAAAWIGLNDVGTEGLWLWEDGSAPAYTQWWSGEPNDSGGEDCAGIGFGDWGWWNDYNCGSSLPFICEL